jgi:predicted site-specific integrase-resolvase
MTVPKNTTTKAASGQLVGYARVSTRQQDLALQLDALNQAGCERIFRDVGSGTLRKRPSSTRVWNTCAQATRSSSGALTGSAAACATWST